MPKLVVSAFCEFGRYVSEGEIPVPSVSMIQKVKDKMVGKLEFNRVRN